MLSSAGTVSGIDLGTQAVRLARARGRNRPERIVNLAEEPIGPADASAWAPATAAAMDRLLRRERLKPRDLGRVAVAVAGSSVHLRQVEMPLLSDQELQAALRFEARRHLPLEHPAAAAVDCQVLGKTASGQGLNVLLVAAPEELVQSRVRALEEVGVEPEIVDAAPLALLNGFFAQPLAREHPESTVAILILEPDAPAIVMTRKDGPVYARTLTSALDLKAPAEVVAHRLAAAFRETAQFFAQMNERRPVDWLCLGGEGSLIPGLDAHLSEELSLPVSPLDLTAALLYSPAGSGGPTAAELRTMAPRYAVALGLLYWGNGSV